MPMSTDGKRDMFWEAEWDPTEQQQQCREQFGVVPQEGWAAVEYGGYDSWSQGEDRSRVQGTATGDVFGRDDCGLKQVRVRTTDTHNITAWMMIYPITYSTGNW